MATIIPRVLPSPSTHKLLVQIWGVGRARGTEIAHLLPHSPLTQASLTRGCCLSTPWASRAPPPCQMEEGLIGLGPSDLPNPLSVGPAPKPPGSKGRELLASPPQGPPDSTSSPWREPCPNPERAGPVPHRAARPRDQRPGRHPPTHPPPAALGPAQQTHPTSPHPHAGADTPSRTQRPVGRGRDTGRRHTAAGKHGGKSAQRQALVAAGAGLAGWPASRPQGQRAPRFPGLQAPAQACLPPRLYFPAVLTLQLVYYEGRAC